MSRTVYEIPMYTNNVDAVLQILENFMSGAGYSNKFVDGENVWCKGDGVIMKMQCFSVVFTGSSVLLNAWLKDAITGESDLEGFAGILPKRKMKQMMENIRQTIISYRI